MAAILRGACSSRAITASLLVRSLSTSPVARSKVAVILSGCGVYDGSEVHEASAILVHLSEQLQGGQVDMFAPDVPQMHVINHIKGELSPGETRNVLAESARIARGNVTDLGSLDTKEYDAILFPGGFGAAKNLSTFAVDGANMTVNRDVERVLKEFHSTKKPIGLCCISPVLAAKVLPGVSVTVGSDQDPAAQAIVAMGSSHVQKSVTESHTDEVNKIVTTPAFMYEAPLHQIFQGIGSMVAGVVKLIHG